MGIIYLQFFLFLLIVDSSLLRKVVPEPAMRRLQMTAKARSRVHQMKRGELYYIDRESVTVDTNDHYLLVVTIIKVDGVVMTLSYPEAQRLNSEIPQQPAPPAAAAKSASRKKLKPALSGMKKKLASLISSHSLPRSHQKPSPPSSESASTAPSTPDTVAIMQEPEPMAVPDPETVAVPGLGMHEFQKIVAALGNILSERLVLVETVVSRMDANIATLVSRSDNPQETAAIANIINDLSSSVSVTDVGMMLTDVRFSLSSCTFINPWPI